MSYSPFPKRNVSISTGMSNINFPRKRKFYLYGKYRYEKCDIMDCQFGLRKRCYNILAGPVLTVWTKVESVLNSKSCEMQVINFFVFCDNHNNLS